MTCCGSEVMLVVRALLWLLVLVTLSGAQRTYQRHCECEYFVDGRCAYTLLLPTTNSGEMTCPLSNSSGALTRLQNDVSALQTWTGEEAKALVTLQNTVRSLAAAVQSLQDADGGESDMKESPDSQTGAIDAVKSAVDQLNRTVVELTTLCRGRCSNDQLPADSNTTTLLETVERRLVSKYRLCAVRGLINIYEIQYSSVSQSAATNTSNYTGVWCPSNTAGSEAWIQFDVGKVRPIYAVVTQGRDASQDWVTAYKMMFFTESFIWTTYTDAIGNEMVFTGNYDNSTVKVNDLWQPISAQSIRLLPTGWHGDAACMRAGLVGCLDELET